MSSNNEEIQDEKAIERSLQSVQVLHQLSEDNNNLSSVQKQLEKTDQRIDKIDQEIADAESQLNVATGQKEREYYQDILKLIREEKSILLKTQDTLIQRISTYNL